MSLWVLKKPIRPGTAYPNAKLYGDSAQLQQEYLDNTGYPGALYNTPGDSINLFNSKKRTYNYFTYANQTDNYRQNHYQLFFNQEIIVFAERQYCSISYEGKRLL